MQISHMSITFYEESILAAIVQSAPIDNGPFRVQTVARKITEHVLAVAKEAKTRSPKYLLPDKMWEAEFVPFGERPAPIDPTHSPFLEAHNKRMVSMAIGGRFLSDLTLAVGFWAIEQMADPLQFQEKRSRDFIMQCNARLVCDRINGFLGMETP